MLKVFVAQNPMEAHLVLGVLEAEGFSGEVRGEALFTTIQGGSCAPGLLPSVWVAQEDQVERARALVAQYFSQTPRPEAGEAPWVCAGCGERHEAQFLQCWKCGSDRA